MTCLDLQRLAAWLLPKRPLHIGRRVCRRQIRPANDDASGTGQNSHHGAPYNPWDAGAHRSVGGLSSGALINGCYKGNPMAVHMKLTIEAQSSTRRLPL